VIAHESRSDPAGPLPRVWHRTVLLTPGGPARQPTARALPGVRLAKGGGFHGRSGRRPGDQPGWGAGDGLSPVELGASEATSAPPPSAPPGTRRARSARASAVRPVAARAKARRRCPRGVAWSRHAARARARASAGRSPANHAARATSLSCQARAATRIGTARSAPQRGQVATPRQGARQVGHRNASLIPLRRRRGDRPAPPSPC
jgi:hypothetical protein